MLTADVQARSPRSTGTNRVLLCSPNFPPSRGGIERTAGALATRLPGYEVEVVAGAPRSNTGREAPPPVPIRWVANDPPGGRKATFLLNLETVRHGLRTKPDIVLALHIRAMPAARALRHRFGSRTLLVVHAKELREQPRLARAAVAWADTIVAVSRYSRDLALEAGADPDRLRIINPGVHLPIDVPPEVTDRPPPPTVVTVSRMDDLHKGHFESLEALSLLRRRRPDVRWIMVGEGKLRGELIEKAASLGLADCVTFAGAVDDEELDQILRNADVFCMLSRNRAQGSAGEGFGIVFIEAGAYGIPVVAGRVPGVVDAVADEQTGLLVDPDDPEAAANALDRLLTDRQLAGALGRAGRARAVELDWADVGQRYATAIDEILDAPRRKPARPQLGWTLDLLTSLRDP